MLSSINDRINKFRTAYFLSNINDVVQALRMYFGPQRTNLLTLNKDRIPDRITGFHDLAYLFAHHYANRGIIAQDIDEAAYLWKTVTDTKPKAILEIGRWLGGSTILLCSAAAQYGGKVISVDLKIKAPQYAEDRLIEQHLNALHLDNYELHVGSSYDFSPSTSIDLAFIDGDHSYEGVKKDHLNVLRHLNPGGHLIFHDAGASRPFTTVHEPVQKLMQEMKQNNAEFRLCSEVGSLVHFQLVS